MSRWKILFIFVGVTALLTSAVATARPHPVGPTRSYAKFESKSTTTAESALSVVETTRLAVYAVSEKRAFGPYTSVLISEQEDSLSGLSGTFRSIQPPDRRADALRDELTAILYSALDHVSSVRISARRGELQRLNQFAPPLKTDADSLRRFLEEHK